MRHRPNTTRRLNYCLLALLIVIGSWSVSARAQDPLTAFPKNYRLVFENSSIKVIRVHYGAHEKIGIHDHSSFPTIYVYLSDSGPVRLQHFEEKSFTLIRPPTTEGAFRIAPARPERHSVENIGDISSEFLRVELKQASPALREPFRGKAPRSPLQNGDSVEFTDPALKIQRIICADSSTCQVKPSPAPSLIIAFAPLSMTTGGSEKVQRLDTGAIRWLPSSQTAAITPDASSPAHILRILLPVTQKH